MKNCNIKNIFNIEKYFQTAYIPLQNAIFMFDKAKSVPKGTIFTNSRETVPINPNNILEF
jgi:hypothetical protein